MLADAFLRFIRFPVHAITGLGSTLPRGGEGVALRTPHTPFLPVAFRVCAGLPVRARTDLRLFPTHFSVVLERDFWEYFLCVSCGRIISNFSVEKVCTLKR